MSSSHRESGRGLLNAIFGLFAMAIIALGLLQVLPVQTRKSKLTSFMVDQTKLAGSSSAKSLEKRVFEKARELGAPVSKDDVRVHLTDKKVRITCRYTEELDFFLYTHNWPVDLQVDRPVYHF